MGQEFQRNSATGIDLEMLARSFERDVPGCRPTEALGAGAFADVVAVTSPWGAAVAKIGLAPGRAALEREARMLYAAKGPGIPAPWLFATLNGGRPVLIMSRCAGKPLRSIQPQSEAEAARLADGVLKRLAQVHRSGLVHADVKPSNLLVDGCGRLSLVDFGLARRIGEPVGGDEVAGTPPYMSPEQLGGDALTPASDLYALGVLLYELLCGSLPFRAENLAAMSVCKRRGQFPAPSSHGLENLALERLLFRMLRPGPEERPSLDEAREALARASHSPMKTLPPPTTTEDTNELTTTRRTNLH